MANEDTSEQVPNRMADAPDLDALRGSSEKPGWLARQTARVGRSLRSRTAVTILLFLTILIAIGLVFWTGG